MGRSPSVAGIRDQVAGVRLTPAEMKRLVDDKRGSLSRSAYLRWLLIKAAKE